MLTGYHPLTHDERCQIHARLYRGLSKLEIAGQFERAPTTISRKTSRHRRQRGDRHRWPTMGSGLQPSRSLPLAAGGRFPLGLLVPIAPRFRAYPGTSY